MFTKVSVTAFFDGLKNFYLSLPDADKLVVYIILILIFILAILLIIMMEQKRVTRKIVDKQVSRRENTEVLEFDMSSTEIDSDNEKTRNLKEITDKIQSVLDNRNIDLTKFEQDQEESSIISYDELIKSVGKQPEQEIEEFSLPNLVHKIEVDDKFEQETPYIDPIKEGKFKSSVFISPVFGIQEQNKVVVKEEIKQVVQEQSYNKEEYSDEEKFLNNLISFRKNLE